MPGHWVEWRTRGGEPISHGDVTITPRSQSLVVRFPFIQGGLVWNRPHSVLVQHGQDEPSAVPVIDHTRIVQLALLGIGLLGAAILGRLLKNE